MEAQFSQDKLVNVIRTATEDVFSTMLMVALEGAPAYQERESAQTFDGVIALIGLAGTYVGSGRIACAPALACRLSGALLACEFPAVNEDVLDAIAAAATDANDRPHQPTRIDSIAISEH